MHASSVLIWNIIEMLVLSFIFYVFNVQSKLRTMDLIAYCGYKYVAMIASLFSYLLTKSLMVHRCSLIYVSLSLSYFLVSYCHPMSKWNILDPIDFLQVKCLRLQILPDTSASQSHNNNGNKRRIYLLLLIVCLQPIFIWYLTRHLIVA
jgi:protein transport protein YIF1